MELENLKYPKSNKRKCQMDLVTHCTTHNIYVDRRLFSDHGWKQAEWSLHGDGTNLRKKKRKKSYTEK